MEALTFVNIEWVKPLLKQLRDIRGKREQEVNAVADVFGDPRVVLKYYIEPNCQHHNPADYHEEQISRAFLKEPLHQSLQGFLAGETLVRGNGSNQMFILADAGMGKTTLLLMLKMWHLFAFWPQEYDCLLLKLGDDSLANIQNHANKAKTVLLLDALDEDPKAHGRLEDRLRELLDASANFRHVILTCRTQFFPPTGVSPFGDPGRVTVGGKCCPMLFLSLFDDRQVDEYLHKRFPDAWHRWLTHRHNPRRVKAKAILSSMQSLRFRPLLLAHIDDLLKAKDRLNTAYDVFAALVRVWLLREIGKMEKQPISPMPTVEELWAACRLLAVYLQLLGSRELDADALGALMHRLPAIRHLEKLDFGGRSLLNRNSKHEYRFSHYSIQEFLVVHSLNQGEIAQDMARCPTEMQGKKIKLTAQMFGFLSGSAKMKRLQEYHQLLDWQDLTLTKLLEWIAKGKLDFVTVQSLEWRSPLKDGGLSPEMIILPAGSFWMGSLKGDKMASLNEFPRHKVTLSRPFAMGRFPVTFDDYDRYCEATGASKPNDRGWGRGNRPVIHVSWDDAQAYCEWLRQQTGQPYRLPTEAEWEYAARAGTDTAYWWGDKLDANRANGRDTGSQWSGNQTSPVEAFAPNPFGLHDMLGNVWEWVQDRWQDNYQDAPEDGRAWELGDGEGRVIRGGSWVDPTDFLRCAVRGRYHPYHRYNIIGFRLVLGSPW